MLIALLVMYFQSVALVYLMFVAFKFFGNIGKLTLDNTLVKLQNIDTYKITNLEIKVVFIATAASAVAAFFLGSLIGLIVFVAAYMKIIGKF